MGVVTLTDAGRSVLAGRLDRVVACGIERWLGGVHLQSGGAGCGDGMMRVSV